MLQTLAFAKGWSWKNDKKFLFDNCNPYLLFHPDEDKCLYHSGCYDSTVYGTKEYTLLSLNETIQYLIGKYNKNITTLSYNDDTVVVERGVSVTYNRTKLDADILKKIITAFEPIG